MTEFKVKTEILEKQLENKEELITQNQQIIGNGQ
jgi:hypothetical protein